MVRFVLLHNSQLILARFFLPPVWKMIFHKKSCENKSSTLSFPGLWGTVPSAPTTTIATVIFTFHDFSFYLTFGQHPSICLCVSFFSFPVSGTRELQNPQVVNSSSSSSSSSCITISSSCIIYELSNWYQLCPSLTSKWQHISTVPITLAGSQSLDTIHFKY